MVVWHCEMESYLHQRRDSEVHTEPPSHTPGTHGERWRLRWLAGMQGTSASQAPGEAKDVGIPVRVRELQERCVRP
jgi:hypothetical protein